MDSKQETRSTEQITAPGFQVCAHEKETRIRKKLHPFSGSFQITFVMECDQCKRQRDVLTDYHQYGRGKMEPMYEIKKSPIIDKNSPNPVSGKEMLPPGDVSNPL